MTAKAGSKTSKPDAANSAPPKSETPKPETPKPETPNSDTSNSTNKTDSAGGKKSSAPARPISYFSSVSNDDYRSGWDNIFNSGKKKSTRKPAKSAAVKRTKKLPVNITLDANDLDPETREQLEAAFRRVAQKNRLNYDKLLGNGQVTWQIACHITDR